MLKILNFPFIKEISRQKNKEEIEEKVMTEEMVKRGVVVEEEEVPEVTESLGKRENKRRNMLIKKRENNLKIKKYFNKEY